jgi:hypothetical protein
MFALGMEGAFSERMSALVLAGLATTTTRTPGAACFSSADAWRPRSRWTSQVPVCLRESVRAVSEVARAASRGV